MEAISLDLIQLINGPMAWEYGVVPFLFSGGVLSFYAESGDMPDLRIELEILTGKQIHLVELSVGQLEQLLIRYYPGGNMAGKEQLNVSDDFLIQIIDEAKALGSSDVHIEAYEERCRV